MSDSAGAGMRCSQLKREMCALPAVNPEAQPDFSAAYARHAAAGKASAAAAAGRTLVSGAVHMNISQGYDELMSCKHACQLVHLSAHEADVGSVEVPVLRRWGCRRCCASFKERRKARA